MVEVLGWLLVGLMWILTFLYYEKLPDTIPVHYNIAGQIDGYGSKTSLLVLPAVATVLFVGLTILNRFPWIFNYPVKITADNAHRQYSMATGMIRYLKTTIVLVFGYLSYMTMRNSGVNSSGLSMWFLPIVLCLIFLPIVIYLIKAFRSSDSGKD